MERTGIPWYSNNNFQTGNANQKKQSGQQPDTVSNKLLYMGTSTHLSAKSSCLFFSYPAETGQTSHVHAKTPTGCTLWPELTTYVSLAMSLTTY